MTSCRMMKTCIRKQNAVESYKSGRTRMMAAIAATPDPAPMAILAVDERVEVLAVSLLFEPLLPDEGEPESPDEPEDEELEELELLLV